MSKKFLVDIDLQQNELIGTVIENLATAPANPKAGQHYFNTTDNTEYFWDGTKWVNGSGDFNFQNGIVQDGRNVELDIATGADAGNVVLTADANGLSASVDLSGKVDKLATKPTAGDYTKVTINTEGQVTAGTTLAESDIPDLHLAKITDVTATAAEVNVLDGITATTTELNYVDGVTSSIQDQLDAKVEANTAITGATKTKITYDSKGLVTAGDDLAESDIPALHLAKITDVTATAEEVNVLDGITATTAELNILDGVTADASEINILDGATLTTTELNYVDGVTSSIQDQLDAKLEADDLSIASGSANYLGYDSSTKEFSANVDTNVTANSTNLVTSGAVKAAIDAAITGGVHYAGTWDITSATDYSDITLPQTKGALFYVTGTGPKTIGGIEWNAGDYLLINDDVAAGGSLVGKVEKIDNTESADIVRLNASQTLTNKTIDADDNTISDLTTSNLKSGVLQTTVRATASASDTALASEKAIATALDDKQDKVSTAVENNIATWDDEGNTKDSGKAFTTTVRASTSASDDAIATEKAVATFVETSMSGAKATVTNGALTPVSGVATWSITGLAGDPYAITIIETATGEEVVANVTFGTKSATIKMNSASAISADVYTAKILM